MVSIIFLLALAATSSAFVLPIRVAPSPVTSITQGGQTLNLESQYFLVANLTIGTPGQLFSVVIDTRTADLVVPDITCSTELHCYNKRKFNSSASTSYYKFGYATTFKNNLGTFKGFAGNDVAVIGDRKTDLITIPALKFMQVTSLPVGIEGLNADGVLGMAHTGASQIGGNSPFVQGVHQGDISNTFFSIWLEHFNQTADLGTHGVIYYGGLDPVHCVPNPVYIPLSNGYQYQVTISNLQSVGSAGTNSQSKYIQAIVDSTDGRIAAPSVYIDKILASIGLKNVPVYPPLVPCDTKISLTFTFSGGATATITERDLVTSYFGNCRLQVIPSSNGMISLGIPFFRGRCIYFDPIMEKIGLTPAILQN